MGKQCFPMGQCFSIGQCLSMAFELINFASFWTLFGFDLRRFSLYTEKQVQMGVLNKEKWFNSNSIEMHCPIEKHYSIGKHCPIGKHCFPIDELRGVSTFQLITFEPLDRFL